VKVRALFPLAAAAGLWVPASLAAQPPANPNQQLADTVAAGLRGADVAGASVSIVAQDGTVYLTGTVRDAAQKEKLVAAAKGVAGVVTVRDGLATPGSPIVRVQDLAPVAPMPLAPTGPAPYAGGNPIVEPAPLGVPGAIDPSLQAPPLPPHAWPTYAPYNNLSRVGYPEAYPYNAFPFIGPYYPFPKVPLGWRKVTLEWEDGHWYIGRNSSPHDYWKVRFW
jgi:hypothetical protein